VKAGDPLFQTTVGCRAACDHRASCIPAASDTQRCVANCSQLGYTRANLDKYAQSGCDEVNKVEPEFEKAAACLTTCKHVVECKVPGEVGECVGECMGNLGRKVYTLETVRKYADASCDVVKKDIRIKAPKVAASGGGGGGGGGGSGCSSNGVNDCGSFRVCCNTRAGRMTAVGERGMCLSLAVCIITGQ
jgi:hypothetical protein